MKQNKSIRQITALFLMLLLMQASCKKENYYREPDLTTLKHSLQACAAVSYCASIAVSAFMGESLPPNVIYNSSSQLILININSQYPLPFNKNIGQIAVSGLWQNNHGILSILFSKIDILNAKIKFYGLYTIPIEVSDDGRHIFTLFARQDIIVGNGSDTILNMSNISGLTLNEELERLGNQRPEDVFVAVKQHVWMMDIFRPASGNSVYDDKTILNGGGQIVEVMDDEGGISYSAILNTSFCHSGCALNPTQGIAFLQDFKSPDIILPDVSNAYFSFYNQCNGGLHVDFASGRYKNVNDKYLFLDF